jgi:hypothetical protein
LEGNPQKYGPLLLEKNKKANFSEAVAEVAKSEV